MRIVSGLLAVCGMAALVIGCGSKSEEPVGKKAAKPAVVHEAPGSAQQSGCEDDLLAVFFVSRATLPAGARVPPDLVPKVGFAVGKGNTILKTEDGGRAWRRVVAPKKEKGPEFGCVLFNSPSEGWVVDRGLLLHTSDGGESWRPVPKLPGMFYYFGAGAVTASSYFQIQPPTCGATVWKTADGAKWMALRTTLPRNDYGCLFFLDDLHGWLGGNYGVFAMTEDGGQTWREANIADRGNCVEIQFMTPKVGWMRRYLEGLDGLRYTSDGGATWQKLTTKNEPEGSIADMQFLDEKVGFVLLQVESGKARVVRTMDGGKTWERMGLHHTDLTALCFIDPKEGWVVGEAGCIFHYAK